MKEKINGLSVEKIISDYEIDDCYIKVNYFDKSSVIVENTEKNLQKITSIMNEQAKEFVKDSEEEIKKLLEKTDLCIRGIICLLIVILGTYLISPREFLYVCKIELPLITPLAVWWSCVAIKCKKRVNDIRKYDLFLKEVQDIMPEYDNICDNELKLKIVYNMKNNKCKETDIEKVQQTDFNGTYSRININNLDTVSLKKLKEVILKVNRYKELTTNEQNYNKEIEKIKIKSNINK